MKPNPSNEIRLIDLSSYWWSLIADDEIIFSLDEPLEPNSFVFEDCCVECVFISQIISIDNNNVVVAADARSVILLSKNKLTVGGLKTKCMCTRHFTASDKIVRSYPCLTIP